MVHSPQISRVAARTATFALAVLIAIGGIPASAFAGMRCDTTTAHCQKQAVREHHCADDTALMSCDCQGAELPANSNASRATDLITAAAHGSHSYVPHTVPPAAPSRLDYPLARGRHLVPLTILHSSLLI
jgi:hypothetical protein